RGRAPDSRASVDLRPCLLPRGRRNSRAEVALCCKFVTVETNRDGVVRPALDMSSIIPFAYNRAGNALLAVSARVAGNRCDKKNAAKTGQGPRGEVSRPGCA